MSSLQMKKHNNGPDAYIVARVFNLASGQPAAMFFPRPYQWHGNPGGDLEFGSQNDTGDTPVRVKRPGYSVPLVG